MWLVRLTVDSSVASTTQHDKLMLTTEPEKLKNATCAPKMLGQFHAWAHNCPALAVHITE